MNLFSGPLIVEKGNKWFLVGVTSFGFGCANPRFSGVYARVTKALDWINTNIGENVCES